MLAMLSEPTSPAANTGTLMVKTLLRGEIAVPIDRLEQDLNRVAAGK